MIRTILGVVLIACLTCAFVDASPLTILYTNDLHARLDRLASLSNIIAAERSRADSVLLLDAGDTWHDHRRLITNVWGSEQTVAWMNTAPYSAMAIGNHDTYWGPRRLSQLSSSAQFPIVCANWVPVREGPSELVPSTILRVGGMSILIVGLITAEFLPTPAYPQMGYRDPVASLRAQLDVHEGEFDLVFVVAHFSISAARSIARQVPGVALFITGHSHEQTPEPVHVGATLIVQSGAFGRKLGRLRVDADPDSGILQILSHELIPIERTPLDVRAGVLKLLGVLCSAVLATLVWLL